MGARVRWWNLTTENAIKLSKEIKSEASWKLIGDANTVRTLSLWKFGSVWVKKD